MPRRTALVLTVVLGCLSLFFGCSDETGKTTTTYDGDAGVDADVPDAHDLDAEGPSLCEDGEISGEQTDVDCGGPHCEPCGIGEGCDDDSDCASGFCLEGVCEPTDCEKVDCPEGQSCYRGSCRDVCETGGDCAEDEHCIDGQCAPLDCGDIQCDDGEKCVDGICQNSCEEHGDCPQTECIDGACLDPCENVSCPDGQVCYRGDCHAECSDDEECDDDEHCVDGRCHPVDCEQADCGGDDTCVDGVCYASCQEDGDCPGSKRCEDGACIDPCQGVDCPEGEACYRGGCYAECEEDGDCAGDERCFDGQCRPLDCEGVDCLGYETCYWGTCYDSCDDTSDCDGDAVCDLEACVDPCIDDDGEDCPELQFETLQPQPVEFDAATLRGHINEVPTEIPPDHGLCWSTGDQPDASDDCSWLGPAPTTGEFSAEAEQLSPDTTYQVRAVVDTGDELQYAEEVTFTTGAPVPQGVEATQGDYADRVEISWQPVDDADEYRVFRDGDEIAVVDAPHHDDTQADGPGQLQAPENVEATQGEYTDRVAVNWDAVEPHQPQQYDYRVAAVLGNTESDKSAPAAGWRASHQLEEYAVFRDDTEVATVDPDTTSWDDTGADAGTVPDTPQLTATEGTHTDRVELTWDEPDAQRGTIHDYEVRAVSDLDTGDRSDPVEGWRDEYGVDYYELEIDDGGFANIGDTTSFTDTDADSPTVEPGAASATEGEYARHVEVTLQGAAANPGDPSTYRLRAVNGAGEGDIAEDDGYIGVGELTYQWERSAGASDGNYSAISGADADNYEDEDVPSDGSTRWWRAVVDAEGADAETSDPDDGFRAIWLLVDSWEDGNYQNRDSMSDTPHPDVDLHEVEHFRPELVEEYGATIGDGGQHGNHYISTDDLWHDEIGWRSSQQVDQQVTYSLWTFNNYTWGGMKFFFAIQNADTMNYQEDEFTGYRIYRHSTTSLPSHRMSLTRYEDGESVDSVSTDDSYALGWNFIEVEHRSGEVILRILEDGRDSDVAEEISLDGESLEGGYFGAGWGGTTSTSSQGDTETYIDDLRIEVH